MNVNKGHLLGRYLKVTDVFSFGEKAGLVENEILKSDKRKLSTCVSKVVGLAVCNCAPVVNDTTVLHIPIRRWTQDKNSMVYKPVSTVITLNPGDTEVFELCDFIAYMLNNKKTHGVTLSNGVIKRSSRGVKFGKLSHLESYTVSEAAYFYFSFLPSSKLRLHDPEIKKNVGIKHQGLWSVKDEYKEFFGFLDTLLDINKIKQVEKRRIL